MKDTKRVATQYALKPANAATHNDKGLGIDIMEELSFVDENLTDEDSEDTELENFNFKL